MGACPVCEKHIAGFNVRCLSCMYDGWKVWRGKKEDYPRGKYVEVILREGSKIANLSSFLDWTIRRIPDDIVYYRITDSKNIYPKQKNYFGPEDLPI